MSALAKELTPEDAAPVIWRISKKTRCGQRKNPKKHMKRVLLSWSGGKDSALSLFTLRKNFSEQYEIVGLLTTLTEEYDRISMHGVRKQLLARQSASLGISVAEVWIPKNATNESYEARMTEVMKRYQDLAGVVFGDLFLRDIREYREKFLRKLGLECLFPIWGKNTLELANFFIDSGFRAVVCSLDPRKLDGDKFCGREFDKEFLKDIPSSVDPCGENGEFHTFVYDGPIFKDSIDVRLGEVVKRDGFYFADILPT
jgi:uncharacterized protein (TIGR00290 family)